MRGHTVKQEPIQNEIGLLDIEVPQWPFLVAAGVGGLVIGILIGRVLP